MPDAASLARAMSLAACILLLGCTAEPAEPGIRTVRSGTSAGAAVRVASFARSDGRCEQAGLATAAVTAPPMHGTLSVRQAVLTAGGRLYSGSTSCRDKLIPGIELWCRPANGFRGTDRMRYEIDAGEGPFRFDATVDVR